MQVVREEDLDPPELTGYQLIMGMFRGIDFFDALK